jgi:hypothetical protein
MKMGQEWDIAAFSAGQVFRKSFLRNEIELGSTAGKMRHLNDGIDGR